MPADVQSQLWVTSHWKKIKRAIIPTLPRANVPTSQVRFLSCGETKELQKKKKKIMASFSHLKFKVWLREVKLSTEELMLLNCGVGETLESPLDCKEIQPVHPKGNQSWIFIGRTDVEAEIPILWPPDVKNWPIWKDPDAGKNWRWEEKGTTEDEMVGWHHQLNGHEFG